MWFWLRLLRMVLLVVPLCGLPTEVSAEISHQALVNEKLGKVKAVRENILPMAVSQSLVKQATADKQDNPDVLFRVEGLLTEGDRRLDDYSPYDVHIFEGQAEQIIRITLSSQNFDAFLLLQDASGRELTQNDDGSEGRDAEIVFRLPTTGRYRVLANAYDGSGRGDYQLTISTADEQVLRQAEMKAKAHSLFNQGQDSFDISQYRKAVEEWQAALEIYRKLDDRLGQSLSLANLGETYERLGEYQRAIGFHQQSLAIERETGNRQGEATSLGSLGTVSYSLGEYQQAIDFHQQHLEISREFGVRWSEANALNNLGITYDKIGEYQRAIDFHQQSLAIEKETGNRQGEATSLGNLGEAYHGLGEYQRAIDFHRQSLAIERETGNRQGEATSLGSLGTAYHSLGESQRAIGFHQQSLAIEREIGDRQGEARSLTNLGITYFSQENVALAEDVFLDAIAMFEQLRSPELSDQNQISLFETQISAYRYLETVFISQDKYEASLEISERGRTQAFVRLLSEKLSTEAENQEIQKSSSFQDIQEIAKEQNSTLVEYSFSDTASRNGASIYVWLVLPTGEIYFKEISVGDSLKGITELVQQSRSAMNVRGRGGSESIATISVEGNPTDELRKLHQLFIEPIKQWLPNDPEQRVVFIPQGDLFLVPFPALQDESGTHLIEQHTILTAPSIQVLDLAQRQTNDASNSGASNELLAIGNPVMPEVWDPETDVSTQLSALSGAEQEAKAIASFFNAEALIGARATEQAVKQQIGNARIVHLATHGLLEYGVPEESGVRDVPGAIALTPGNGEDGLLTSVEILEELDLKAELVVLSACDTGLGTITGDGVIGLSRSLIAAGTPSVMVSLWSIPDAPTAELMTEFYRQMQQGQDKAQALRQAMLVTMKTNPNPRNWAAFTLIGGG